MVHHLRLAVCTYVYTYTYTSKNVHRYAATPCGYVVWFLLYVDKTVMADQRMGTKRSHNTDDVESPETKRHNLQEGRNNSLIENYLPPPKILFLVKKYLIFFIKRCSISKIIR